MLREFLAEHATRQDRRRRLGRGALQPLATQAHQQRRGIGPSLPKAADGTRTRDLELGKLALYQLSYRRTSADITRAGSTLAAREASALPILISLAGACLIGLLIYGVSAQSASRTLDEPVAQGQRPRAPDATRPLPALRAAAPISLASFRGKVVVLNFWASWCEPCQVEAPLLERAQSQLERHDATVLGVTYLDASPDSQSVRAPLPPHLSQPARQRRRHSLTPTAPTSCPRASSSTAQGRVVAISRGEIDQAFLNRAIALAESS